MPLVDSWPIKAKLLYLLVILISASKQYSLLRWLSCKNTASFFHSASIDRNAADSGFGFFFNLVFGFGGTIPVSKYKTTFFIQYLHKFIPSVYGCDMLIAVSLRLIENTILDILQQFFNIRIHAIGRDRFFGFGISARNFYLIVS